MHEAEPSSSLLFFDSLSFSTSDNVSCQPLPRTLHLEVSLRSTKPKTLFVRNHVNLYFPHVYEFLYILL